MFYRLLIVFVLIISYQLGDSFIVYDPINGAINQANLGQSMIQTAKWGTQLAQGAQTVANTLSEVDMAKRNLMKFTDWQNLSGFSSIADKIQEASDVGTSLGYASGGIANGLVGMTGDRYSSLSSLEDTLTSVGRTLDTQSAYMQQQNAAYDRIANGLSSNSLDGAVSVMQGNADLLNAIAQQNQDLGNKITTLNKIELARTQNEINDNNLQQQDDYQYQKAALSGLLDYHDNSTFDFSTTPEYTY